MTVTFHAVSLLCALASPALAAIPAGGRSRAVLAIASGFVVSAWWFGARLPDAAGVGTGAALVALLVLVRSDGALAASCAAGVLGGVWMSLLRIEGLPWPAAGALAIAPPLLSANLTILRPLFAPPLIRDEGLLITITLGVAVAILPDFLDGWRSAVALNTQGTTGNGLMVPAWSLALTGGSAALGGLFAVWRRG